MQSTEYSKIGLPCGHFISTFKLVIYYLITIKLLYCGNISIKSPLSGCLFVYTNVYPAHCSRCSCSKCSPRLGPLYIQSFQNNLVNF